MKAIKPIIFTALVLAFLSFDLPTGWGKAGSKRDSYFMGIDAGNGHNGGNAAIIKSIDKKIAGFGTLMQNIDPGAFLGKRIKLTGYIKTQDVKRWAGMWLRVDKEGSDKPLSFDNMGDRPLRATTDWQKCEIVLDVPNNASNIAFGVLLDGTGQVWFDDFQFDIVSTDVAITGNLNTLAPNATPVNLNFESK